MPRAIAVVRGCCQTSSAQTGIRFRFRRRTQLQPASFYEHRFPLFCRTSLPPGQERRACCGYLSQGHRLSPLPQGKTTTPNYSLNHARSGSDNLTASTYPLFYRPRHSGPLRAYLKVIFMGFRGPEALKDNLQDRGDCQNTRKSYKTSYVVGWIVGWKKSMNSVAIHILICWKFVHP